MLKLRRSITVFLALFLLFNVSIVSAAEPIDEVRELIRDYYVDEVPESILSKTTIKEITEHLDPYSVYMSSDEFKQFSNSIDQKLVGIGVVLEEDEKGVKIISTIPQGPAEKAGMVAGDIITNVHEKSLAGESVQSAISLISGKENTSVTLTYYRPSSNQSYTKTLTRQVIQLPNVEFEMLGGNIGFVRLNSFSLDSAKRVADAIQELDSEEGWIFDLRNNGGGYVSAAQEVIGLFPNVTDAFQLQYNYRAPDFFSAIPQATKFRGPTHLLINAYSASASEMVAVSVKEQNGATLYGQNSYGKGTMQSLLTLSDNSVLKMTTAKFYSPQGTAVNQVGVMPDIATAVGEELFISHKDQLINQYKNYKQLPKLKDVPTTKRFTVKMSLPMNWNGIQPKDVQLIQLGGKEVPVELKAVDERTITVVPKEELTSKGQYILFIHPNWKSKTAKLMNQGIYLEITVK